MFSFVNGEAVVFSSSRWAGG